jgi:hypothetical protein
MKCKWRNYALKSGKIEKSYLTKHRSGSKFGKASEASSGNSILESRHEQEKEKITLLKSEDKNEIIREENTSETYQEGRQGISFTDQGRHETKETNLKIKTGEEKMKKVKEKMSAKEKLHESKESKAYEKKEDKREARKEAKGKKK